MPPHDQPMEYPFLATSDTLSEDHPGLFDHSTEFLYRVSGPENAPAVVYLPGIHGDWTPLWRIRELLAGHCRLVEISYPRTAADWTLEDYAERLGSLLDRLRLDRVHLLAESFGSLVAWTYSRRRDPRVRSLMVAGGFASSPGPLRTAVADLFLRLPTTLLDRCVDIYLMLLFRRGFPRDAFQRPDDFFPATRTPKGWRSTHRRLHLIRRTDLRERLCELRVPVLYFAGGWDCIVPVRREVRLLKRRLHRDCGLECVMFPRGPHAVIPVHYKKVNTLIRDWVSRIEQGSGR